MSLQAPLFLTALALIPLGFVAHRLAARRRRRFALRFPGTPTLAAVVPEAPGWRRRVPPVLLALAVAALAVALARPEHTVAVPVERASVMLVMDASGSMEADDVDPTRLVAAKEAATRFLEQVPDQMRVGLVAFSTSPHTVQPPSVDRDAVALTVSALVADGGTATGDALASALTALGRDPYDPGDARGRRPPAAIVLLSDGKATGGRDPVAIAEAARRLRVPIYTVALGTPEGVVRGPFGTPIPVPPDPRTMREIARASGGQAFAVDDAGRLSSVYERLGSQLGTRPKKEQVTAGFAGAGLALLALAALLTVRWRSRLI